MSNREPFDIFIDWLGIGTKWLFERDLIKNWFNILSWTALTAAVIAVAFKEESYFLGAVGVLSVILIFSYGWHSTFHIMHELKETDNLNSYALLSIILFCMSMPIGVGAYMFIFVGNIIKGVSFI